MSRIGVAPINIPVGVSIECDGNRVLVKSAKVNKEFKLCSGVACHIVDNQLLLSVDQSKDHFDEVKPMWGTYRSNINNVINGIVNGFSVDLEITGVGYKAECYNKYLTLYLGYSHNIKYRVPNDVEIKCLKPTHLVISGVDKQRVCVIASDICKIKKYDPYKGKGISIKGRFVLRKVINKKK
ncbi:MAG: 50S ribosomal protein L6 [Wolbachia endosymbiont of Meromenopon meropis]|nr:50S ribosomal protein L6 [Wolbachia endosymbiont of Meromenopon meropis]